MVPEKYKKNTKLKIKN